MRGSDAAGQGAAETGVVMGNEAIAGSGAVSPPHEPGRSAALGAPAARAVSQIASGPPGPLVGGTPGPGNGFGPGGKGASSGGAAPSPPTPLPRGQGRGGPATPCPRGRGGQGRGIGGKGSGLAD